MHSDTTQPDTTKTIVSTQGAAGSTSNHRLMPLIAVIATRPPKMGLMPSAPRKDCSGFRRNLRSLLVWTPGATWTSGLAPVCRCCLTSYSVNPAFCRTADVVGESLYRRAKSRWIESTW